MIIGNSRLVHSALSTALIALWSCSWTPAEAQEKNKAESKSLPRAVETGKSQKQEAPPTAVAAKPTPEAAASHAARGTVFGNWQLLCGDAKAIDPAERCRISQTVLTEKGDQRVLLIRVYGSPATALVSAPHSIFLKPGMIFRVDEGNGRVAAFETCNDEGCHLGLQLDDELLKEIQSGQRLTFSFFDGAAHKVSIPVSLDGFNEAYARLSAR